MARDPLRFPKRYRSDGDVEVAAAFAATLAFGRVTLFGPIIERTLAIADRHGGPAAFADAAAHGHGGTLEGLQYRWLRSHDLLRLFQILGRARQLHGSLAALFRPGTAEVTLVGAMAAFGELLPEDASPGLRSCFATPAGGSACKRWCMFLRWMVRPAPPDLGRWTHLSPAHLVIPLDTHVFRVATFLGLTTRTTPGWRTAVEITEALAKFDPYDPLKYDFALAHLGISGACLGYRSDTVCPECTLNPVCQAPAEARSPPPRPLTPTPARGKL